MDIECVDAASLRNARQLLRIVSYVPREREPEPKDQYINQNAKKCTKWKYTFAATDLKSVSLLIGFCNKNNLRYHVVERGIMVFDITNKQVNQARKKCNKISKKFAIIL